MKGKLALVGAGLLIGAIALTGCSAISSGTVTKKEYHAAYSYQSSYCAYYRTDSKGFSSCAYYAWRTNYVPAEYILDLKAGDKTGWAQVDSSSYHHYAVGDYYSGEGKN